MNLIDEKYLHDPNSQGSSVVSHEEIEAEKYNTLYIYFINNEDDIYTEIIDFIDIALPSWRKNKGLGYKAVDFLLSIIERWFQSKGECTFKEWLTEMYEDIYLEYQDYYRLNQNELMLNLKLEFENKFGKINEHESLIDYQIAFNRYKLNNDEEEYWTY